MMRSLSSTLAGGRRCSVPGQLLVLDRWSLKCRSRLILQMDSSGFVWRLYLNHEEQH